MSVRNAFFWSLLAASTAAKACYNSSIEISVSSRNGVFDNLATPQTNLETTAFITAATRPGHNGTQESLTNYSTVSGTYKISTQYCKPDAVTPGAGPVLQILTHGFAFDKAYWDLPYNNFNYSYVDNALSHGYHTLSYDRLVAALAQITQMARNGSFPRVEKPRKVVHVGHSFGSIQTYGLTAIYPTISDGIILTGFSPNASFQTLFLAGANFQQTHIQQPDSGYSPGYLSSSDISANQYLFFSAPYFDPGILPFAEATKQPVTIGELLTAGGALFSSQFTGPVLIITGSGDLPFCGGDCLATGGTAASIPEEAAKGFPASKVFQAYIQPNTGHGLNLHYNATGAYEYIADFLRQNGLGA
ncbi:hypothetical protein BDV27DRAFT_167404 [Aspergillus caelatus]|uniref:Alpha/Beta hydrolase protein n=1 Tax=Aspergillus caelatus TaxID=61420 RepID=A0A5N6ZX70_9EURO|nr:uncharacterized protein BDV27DRAFT_167404 [Aspergillus caelatus]KAE8360860.1 hypothetical protein BDV27DRAFT_167404 [Aspergillus caelatus]